jgi:hypothetical protein
MLDTQSTQPDSTLWQKIVAALVVVIGILGAVIKSMQARLSRATGRSAPIEEAVRNLVHVIVTENLREYDRRFDDLRQQRNEDQLRLQEQLGAIYREIQSLRPPSR